jgi:hypothetical protein
MRQLSFILIIIIGLTTVTPTPLMYSPDGNRTASIQVVDVCHGPATGINVNLPDFIQERPGNASPLVIVDVRNVPDVLFTPLLLTYQDERPPHT